MIYFCPSMRLCGPWTAEVVNALRTQGITAAEVLRLARRAAAAADRHAARPADGPADGGTWAEEIPIWCAGLVRWQAGDRGAETHDWLAHWFRCVSMLDDLAAREN